MPVNDSGYEREKRVAVRRNGMKGLTFFKNLDTPVRVIWLIGISFCFFPFIYGPSEEQFESVEGSKDFSVSFAVSTAFALPIIMDGLIERGVAKITGNCIGGQLYYDTCKYKVVMGAVVAVPNFIIMLYTDTPSIYLCFSHLQQVLLCLFVINNVYDISFVRNGISIWDGQTRALLMSLTVAASCFQLLHAVLLTDSLLYLTVISVVVYVAFLGFKVVCWVFECFLENVKHFEDSSGDSYERKCLAYDVLAVSVYVVALLVYVLVNIGVGATHHVGAIQGIKARVYCGALLGVFLALVPAKSRHLKMRAMEDEYHNKRIYVQYVSQEAIHPLNCALQGFQLLVDDASRRSLNNTLSGPGAVAAMAHMAQLSQIQGPGAAAEALASASRITEIRQHCLASKKCLLDLVRFDKFDTGAVLGQREDISMWKFVRAQADYFSTQMYHKRISLRLFSRLNGAAPVEEDDRGISFLGGSYSMSASAGLAQSFEDIIISDCVKTCTVLGNKHRLAQVFRHLVHNALRFSPLNGDICIVLELKEHPEDTTLSLPRGARRKYADDASLASEDFEASDDGVGQNRKSDVAHTLRVEIRDRGPGVEKAEVGRLFSKRRQRKKEQGGIGLWRKFSSCLVLLYVYCVCVLMSGGLVLVLCCSVPNDR
jgi:signal transduction histidine kinase